jgi:hypothetical protein
MRLSPENILKVGLVAIFAIAVYRMASGRLGLPAVV